MKTTTQTNQINFSKILTSVIILGVILFIGGLVYFNTSATRNGPIITLSEPHDGQTILSSKVTLKGDSERVQSLYVNNDLIALDPSGSFLVTLPLAPGESIITLRALDKFDKEITKVLHLYAQYPHTPVADITTIQPVIEQPPPDLKVDSTLPKGSDVQAKSTPLEIINSTNSN